jgi:F-type H+-transporting ATPase subunit alpha
VPALRERVAELIPEIRGVFDATRLEPRTEQVGRVERVGDGIAAVSGLPDARLDELLRFSGGTRAMAMTLRPAEIGCVLLGPDREVRAGDQVRCTGAVVRTPVGDALLGRVVDALGRPLDGGPPIAAAGLVPVERPAPPIVDRAAVTHQLYTGLLAVDAMLPLGRGQRELIVGDRGTGRTTVALDAMIAQRDTEVICVYAAIGQNASSVREVIDAVRTHGAFDRSVFVVAESDAPPGLQWLAPYAATTIAEHYMESGRHALVVFDDLTKHAAIHRQLSLLLRQPPGREAYPGDVFYIHSRLLERAAQLSDRLGGGSLTALPIAETQAGNLTAYIPTNLVSITDGQIVLSPKLFAAGQRPAVDVGLSVSRVGGKTQAPAIKQLAKSLRLEYARVLELEAFTRFGGVIDERTQRGLEHGRRIRAVLRQRQHRPLTPGVQLALLLAIDGGMLDELGPRAVDRFRAELPDAVHHRCGGAMARIAVGQELSSDDRESLIEAVAEIAREAAR